MIKAVHLTTVDKGGAYKAVCRIVESLKAWDVESTIVVRTKENTGNAIEYNSTLVKTLSSKTRNFGNLLFANEKIQNDVWGCSVLKLDEVKNADIVFVHWVNSFVEYKQINSLLKNKKVILVLHDMEHITGGCHYSLTCDGYKNGCNPCPDTANWLMRTGAKYCNELKHTMWGNKNCYSVAISEWMKETAYSSQIVGGDKEDQRIRRIWNPIDTSVFKPYVNESIRGKLAIDNRPVILFGADRIGDEVKGTKYIFEALGHIDVEKYNIVCFGTDRLPADLEKEFSMVKCLGRIEDECELAGIYGVADVFVTTATQEAFGYTCCEALACGIPVVAFDIGGMKEQIRHKEWGYLAKTFDSRDVAEGIEYCIANAENMRNNAIDFVEKSFSYEVIGKQYFDFVECILDEKRFQQ